MPPTIQSQNQQNLSNQKEYRSHQSYDNRGRSEPSRTDDKQELLVRIKYNNTLPDIPFDPKFIAYPFDSNRFVHYKPTSLERKYKFDILTEQDLGVKIDLINPDTYKTDDDITLDPADEKLLEEEPTNAAETKRSAQHSKIVPWLRKTEYISSEFNRYGVTSERHETQLGHNVKKLLNEDMLYKSRDDQIRAIQDTFTAIQRPVIEHYSKPGVFALQQMPLLPDFEWWKLACAQVIFDSEPVPPGLKQETANHALIRGMQDESGEQFVAYFLPTEETLEKRKQDSDAGLDYKADEEYEFKLTREYNWNVKNKASRGYEENYFLAFRDEGVYYNELETRVRLNKRRAREGQPKVSNSRLRVKYRPLNEAELAAQETRQMVLEAQDILYEEDEEVEAGSTALQIKDEDENTDNDKVSKDDVIEKDSKHIANSEENVYPINKKRKIESSGSEKEESDVETSTNSDSD